VAGRRQRLDSIDGRLSPAGAAQSERARGPERRLAFLRPTLGGVAHRRDARGAPLPDADVLQVFYQGADHALWTLSRNPDGFWSDIVRLGGNLAGDPYTAVVPA
jgi:hypothetical protein